jgi:uncharacterized membrane protein (DUF485 family)
MQPLSVTDKIMADPNYLRLRTKRNRLAIILTLLMLVSYYSYIGLIAFHKAWLATPIHAGSVITLGIPLGIGLIVFTVMITGIYVYRANREFDTLTAALLKEAQS